MYQTNGGEVMSNKSKGINTFQRYLSVWVLLCMAIGVLIGHFVPAIPATLGKFQISGISIPIAVLIWVMIYPMMMKVDFQSIQHSIRQHLSACSDSACGRHPHENNRHEAKRCGLL